MKFKFFLFSLFILLMCSGCTVEYNLDIDKSLNLNESIAIEAVTNDDINNIRNFNTFLPVDISVDELSAFESKKDGVEYYKISKNKDNSIMNFDYSYDIDRFNNNLFARSCYEYVTVMDSYNEESERDELILSTSKDFLCFDSRKDLESVIIKIHTKKDVYFNNADSVEDDTYIWNITEANKNDAAISMVISSEVVGKKMSFFEKNALFIIFIGATIVGSIIYFIMKKHSDKINEI